MSSSNQLRCQSCRAKLKPNSTFCTECGSQVIITSKNEINDNPIQMQVSDRDVYVGYVQIIAVVEIAFGFFISLIGGILILLGGAITPLFIPNSEISSELLTLVKILIFIIGVLLVIFGILSVYFGSRLYQFTQMGRIGTMVISALQLINFPFGTIFGVVALYMLVKPEIIALFEK